MQYIELHSITSKINWGLRTDPKQGMITESDDFSQKIKDNRGVIPSMKRKLICAGLVSLMIAALTACSSAKTSNAETSEAESSAPETYDVNMTSVGDGADSEYEIDDMLPRPSDDTYVISVEEAEAHMNKNTDNDAE